MFVYNKNQNMQIISPLLPLLGQEAKCYACGGPASHIGLDGTCTCAKEICVMPLLRVLRAKVDYVAMLYYILVTWK